MNLFYILLYNYLYNDTTELFDYLQTPFSLTEANPFSSLFSKHMINCESLSHTMLQLNLNKYMKWYESMRSNELRIDIVKIHNMKMKLMFEYGGNLFFSRQTKDTIFKIYQNIQKHYLVLIRFFAICARRRIRKNPTVSTDLYLTDLIMENKNTFLLYQNKSLYMFSLNDLMHLFESALCYRYESDFQVLPVIPKNPYNNILFERDDLYNIYFFMRFSTCKIIPLFFHLWFLEDFQFRPFYIKHMNKLRELCIKHFVNTVDCRNRMIYSDICDIIKSNRYTKKWEIHNEFPRKILVDTMRPILYIYYLLTHDLLSCEESITYEAKLWSKLTNLYHKNPKFGKKKKERITAKFKPFVFNMSQFEPYQFGSPKQDNHEYVITLESLFSHEENIHTVPNIEYSIDRIEKISENEPCEFEII